MVHAGVALDNRGDRRPVITGSTRAGIGALGTLAVQHVAQAAESWPDATPTEREEGARLADSIEHIHWRVWHGQVRRASI